jgi:MFS family permease
MYGLEWIEQLKLRLIAPPQTSHIRELSPVVWQMGFVSFLTDISAEMVNSALPGYLVLYLHLSPLEYGAIDGVYNGLAVALVSLAAGIFADHSQRPKRMAMLGYGLSAVCKLLMLAAAATGWVWILASVWLDRTGKSIRTAPRDAIISRNSSSALMASSFALHRALDAFGSLLGPLVTFAILWRVPTRYTQVWLLSFVFAVLGTAVLRFAVKELPAPPAAAGVAFSVRAPFRQILPGPALNLSLAALLLASATISDGFIYLLLQKAGGPGAAFFPLFYLVTACFYIVLSVPAGRLADRVGRLPVFILGYAALGVIYLLLFRASAISLVTVGVTLGLLGTVYATTEGILTAMVSVAVPQSSRATGIALVVTLAGIGKVLASIAFGWIWETYGTETAIRAFGVALAAAMVMGVVLLASRSRRTPA